MKTPILLSFLVLSLCCLMSCSIDTISGGTTDTGNAIYGYLVDRNGNPAQQARVCLLQIDFNPITNIIPDSLIDTTESNGFYRFNYVNKNTYNIYAIHLKENTSALIKNIVKQSDSLQVPTDTIKEPGVLNIILPDTVDTTSGFIYIEGTTIYQSLSAAKPTNNNEFLLTLHGVPEASISSIILSRFNDPTWLQPVISDTIQIKPKETTEIPAFVKWINYTKDNSPLFGNRIMNFYLETQNYTPWFCTNYGLYNSGDSGWVIYIPSNSGIPSETIHSFAIDNLGNYWIATDRGLGFYDKQSWLIYDTSHGNLPAKYITDIAVDSSNNIWVGMHRGIAQFRHTLDTFAIHDSTSTIHAVLADNKKQIWFASDSGIHMYKDSIKEFFLKKNTNILSDTIFCLAMDKNNTIWFGHNHGLSRFNGSSWQTFDVNTSPLLYRKINTIYPESNITWFGTSQGLIKYDGKNWVEYSGKSHSLLNNTKILSIVKDPNGNIWLGTESKGIIVFGPSTEGIFYGILP